MSVVINRLEFLSRLQAVSPGLARREIVEQSTCFIFDKGKIFTFNDEVCCRCKSGLPDDYTAAVPSTPLLNLLDKLSEETVTISMEGDEVVITGERRRAGVRMEKQITMPMTGIEEPKKWQELPDNFDEALVVTSSCSSPKNARFVLTCVHITQAHIEALDNTQLCRYTVKVPVQDKCLIRSEAIMPITSLGMTKIGETSSWLHFKNSGGLIYSCRKYLEEFPDLAKFLIVKGSPLKLPPGIPEAVEKAEIFSKENASNDKVKVEIKPGKLRIHGQGTLGWFQEMIKFSYDGQPLSFMIRPSLLREIVKRHDDFIISPERMKVDGNNYTYVTCLTKTEDKKDEE